jgi:hypothetical protein
MLLVHASHGKVLGDTITPNIIDDSALEAADPSATLSAKPADFDSTVGRWDYTITYSVSNLNGGGTLTIGTYVVAGNLTVSGTVDTGAILKPNTTYHVSLWGTDSSGNKQNLAHIDLKTGKAKGSSKTPPGTPPCAQPQSASSTPIAAPTFCIKKADGTIQCVPPVCGKFTPDLNKNSTGAAASLGQGGFGHFPLDRPTSTPGGIPPPSQAPPAK